MQSLNQSATAVAERVAQRWLGDLLIPEERVTML
jgi:hypothetical protein